MFIISLCNLFLPGFNYYPKEFPWIVMGAGLIGAIPSCLLCFRKEPTRAEFIMRCVIHFILIEAGIMIEGALLGWYSDFSEALLITATVIVVYILVWTITYFCSLSTAKNINRALGKFNTDEEE